MTRIAYVNCQYIPRAHAQVHVEDRGYQFADGVYEVIAFYNRTLIDGDLHLARLERSLKALEMAMPIQRRAMELAVRELIRRNSLNDGMVYLQVTRGQARRDHVYGEGLKSSLVMTISPVKPPSAKEVEQGTAIIVRDDIRWQRRDIKSIALLPNLLLKNEAMRLGKREAWLVDKDGFITEGAVSNAYIVTQDGILVTRGEEECLLSGITRHRVLVLAKQLGIPVEERAFTPEEAKQAREAFITSSTSNVVPVVQIDDSPLGNGKPGQITTHLFHAYMNYIEQETGRQLWHG